MNQKHEPTHLILVADDEKAIRRGLQVLIMRHYREIDVLEASNGQECWDILNGHPQIPLVFVDIRMPAMDGLQLCEKVKTAGLPTRVVIISGFRDFEYARQALRYGVADYLLKPVNPSDVLRLVHEVVMVPPLAPELTEKQERLIIEQIRKWIHDHLHVQSLRHSSYRIPRNAWQRDHPLKGRRVEITSEFPQPAAMDWAK